MKYLTILFFLFSSIFLQAQQANKTTTDNDTLSTRHKIQLINTYVDGKVILRWSPESYETWSICKLDTFEVSRYLLDEEGLIDKTSKKSWTVRPFTYEEYEPFVKEGNASFLATAELLHGAYRTDPNNIYERYHEARNRFIFAMVFADKSLKAAEAMGLRMEDKTIEQGKAYFYIVLSLSHPTIEGGFKSITTHEEMVFPLQIDSILEQESKVVLIWDRARHNPHYTGYYIERSRDGVNFTRLNEELFLSAMTDDFTTTDFRFIDSIPNSNPHFYRLVGHTPFNFETKPSAALKAQARDITPPLPPERLSAHQSDDASVTLRWAFSAPEDVADVWIQHSLSYDQFFVDLNETPLRAGTLQFTHAADAAVRVNYYRIVYADKNGNTANSPVIPVHYQDSIPPAQPQNLIGTVDSNGVVRLSWDKGPERDLRGYFVYRANSNHHAMTIITGNPVLENTFNDTITLKTLTEEVYYQITAIDYNSNYSPYSQKMLLIRPDTIPPSAPIFCYRSIEDGYIHLKWKSSSSQDVKNHYLYRKEADKADWEIIQIYSDGTEAYLDQKVQANQVYQYKILAVDDAGLYSKSITKYSIRYFETASVPAPIIEAIQFDEHKKILSLNWTNMGEDYKYVIYKAQQTDKPFVTAAYTSFGENEFTDFTIKTGESYCIQAIHKDGRKSKLGLPKSYDVR